MKQTLQDTKDWKEFWKYALFLYWKLSPKIDSQGTSPRERHWKAVKETITPVYSNRRPPRSHKMPQEASKEVNMIK
jgi:hypothetical protein